MKHFYRSRIPPAHVVELADRGVGFETFEGFEQDLKAFSGGDGPNRACFMDPAGNILAVMRPS
jgi:hypothetical protein